MLPHHPCPSKCTLKRVFVSFNLKLLVDCVYFLNKDTLVFDAIIPISNSQMAMKLHYQRGRGLQTFARAMQKQDNVKPIGPYTGVNELDTTGSNH